MHSSREVGKKKKPNVLFIAVDDLRPELGCYGNSVIRTPEIDRLARSGVVFHRAYCQQASCNPSRASLLTGLRPDSVKIWDLRVHFRETVPDVVTLPQHFRRHGYRAVAYGKIYHNPLPDRRSWDEPNHWPEYSRLYSEKTQEEVEHLKEKARREGKTEDYIREYVRGPAAEAEDVPDNMRWDGEIAEQAIFAMYSLSRARQPFFLAVGFILPHLPFVAPKKYWDLYDPREIPEADNPFLPRGAPPMAMNSMYELRTYSDFKGSLPPQKGLLSEEERRRLKHGYYASVSYIDSLIGRLLRFLEKLGLSEETIVVLWGDHGWKLGEHGSWCKQTNYEEDTRSPLIIRAPGRAGNGKVCRGIVEFVDIYPTLCDLAGLPFPDHLEGESLVPLLQDPGGRGKDAAFSQFYRIYRGAQVMGYAIRTDRFRFVEWRNWATGEIAGIELYDHLHDPRENTNVIGRPEYKNVVDQLRARLRHTCPVRTRQRPASMYTQSSEIRVVFEIVNKLEEVVTVYELDAQGARQWIHDMKPGEILTVDTFLTHPFVVETMSGEFYRVIYPDYPQRQVVLQAPRR